MPKVFVVNEPKGSRSALGEWGDVVPIYPGWIDRSCVDEACDKVVRVLEQQYQDGDYIVLCGYMKLNCIAFHWIMSKHQVLRQLLPSHSEWHQIQHDGRPSNGEGKWQIGRDVRRRIGTPRRNQEEKKRH